MHFSKKNGKVQLNLSGNLILSKNADLTSTTSRSASPRDVTNAKYIMLRGARFRQRVKATAHALAFIWGEPDE